jgi:hypothetical protein
MIPHMTRTLLLLLFFFQLKDTYSYSSTSVFFFPLRCKSSLLFPLYFWLISSSTTILFILGTYYQLISVFLSTEVTVILFILVYPLTLPAPEVMGPDDITDMTSSTNKALSLPKLRSNSSNWATYSKRILNYLTSKGYCRYVLGIAC